MICRVVLTLRHNVDQDGDVALARREFLALAGVLSAEDIVDVAALLPYLKGVTAEHLGSMRERTREQSPVAFVASVSVDTVPIILRRSAFGQDLVVTTSADDVPWHDDPLIRRAAPSLWIGFTANALAECISCLRVADFESFLQYAQSGACPSNERACRIALLSKRTTLSLSHDLHIYKAKFFPRMVRALLNVWRTRNGDRELILDPFCGSGTALLEAALLGHRSIGLDVDPIPALISALKVAPFTSGRAVTRVQLQAILNDDLLDPGELPLFPRASPTIVECRTAQLPKELRAKIARRDARDGTSFLPEIEEDLATLTAIYRRHKKRWRGLLEVMLSDAASKKIRYRFVGVGNGKYTIEIVRQRMVQRFAEKAASLLRLCDLFEWLDTRCRIRCAESSAEVGNASNLEATSWEHAPTVCVTSPPYLPASSGREHYAASRELPLRMTGLRRAWRRTERQFLGAHSAGALSDSDLPPEAARLMAYLRSDSERCDPQHDAMRFDRKALPTLGYIRDVQQFLRSLHRLMPPGSRCFLVVAHQHLFYSHRRQENLKHAGMDSSASIEFVMSGRDLYGEIAEVSGWHVEEEIVMGLSKATTSVARPRSSEEYSESVLVLAR